MQHATSINSENCQILSERPDLGRLPEPAYLTRKGLALAGNSAELMKEIPDNSVDLIFTSPPFALRRKKQYGNQNPEDYVAWFLRFAVQFQRILKESGSLVIDIGGSWTPGEPTKSLYHYRLLLALVDEVGLHLAQEVFWYNHARLPTPAQWVCRERERLKDSVNMVWWLSKTTRPKADNRRVLTQYKPDQKKLMASGNYNRGRRPSEHMISDKFGVDNGGAIAPNFLDDDVFNSLCPAIPHESGFRGESTEGKSKSADDDCEIPDDVTEPDNLIRAANTASSDPYIRGCKQIGAQLHPARIPRALPQFFVRFLTEPGDLVLDPFAGSNMTGAVAEGLERDWLAIELSLDYLFASQTRFAANPETLLSTISRFERIAAQTGAAFQYKPPAPDR